MNRRVRPKRVERAVKVTLDATLVDRASALGISLSQFLELHLREAVRAGEEKAWQEANREAIEEHNRIVERDGLWNDDFRTW